LRDRVRFEDAWGLFKRTGIAGLPGGEATEAWKRLDAALRTTGVFVVNVGTLERWWPSIGAYGPKWTVEALEKHVHEQPGEHQDFVRAIGASIP
jgi:hypothetical protein